MLNTESGKKTTVVGGTNGAKSQVEMLEPFVAEIAVQGNCPIIFHRWNVEGIEEKSKAAKGSKAKKTDDVDSYVYRNDDGLICIPGEYLRQSIIHAAKFRQDPRSPRKSLMDIAKAGIFTLEELVPIFSAKGEPAKDWDYLDKRRVTVQRNGLTRCRPAFHANWTARFSIQVVLPEYIDPNCLNELTQLAGKIVGLADGRPSYGRFLVTSFKVLQI